jgi:predicted kinase
LHDAAYQVGTANVRKCLEEGAEINEPGGIYGNALQAASYIRDVDAAKLLLDRGADVNAQGGRFAIFLSGQVRHSRKAGSAKVVL